MYAAASRSAAGGVCTEWLPQDEIVLVLGGRTPIMEFYIGDRLEFDRFARRASKRRQFALPATLPGTDTVPYATRPQDCVTAGGS